MNVRLKRSFDFYAGMVYDQEFSVNRYTLTVSMTTQTSDVDMHNIAYERIKYWINYVLHNSVLISESDPTLEKWLATEQRILILPDQPVDQLVGIMLYLKLTAIIEQQFLISEVEISSDDGDEMIYLHGADESLGPMDANGWWNDPKPNWITNPRKKSSTGKVIKLTRIPEWKELELDFVMNNDNVDCEILVGNFIKDDKK